MGLDVTAYEYAELTEPHEWIDDCTEEFNHKYAYIIDPSFSRSLRGLEEDRCYVVSGLTADTHNSYGGYSEFRSCLSEYILEVGPEEVWRSRVEYVNAPFFELICFADNEGTIGPYAASSLWLDFLDNREVFGEGCKWDDYLMSKYDEWTEVMSVASDTGMVVFH